jgi:hypothetical protein
MRKLTIPAVVGVAGVALTVAALQPADAAQVPNDGATQA